MRPIEAKARPLTKRQVTSMGRPDPRRACPRAPYEAESEIVLTAHLRGFEMKPVVNSGGAVVNASTLRASQVVGEQVVCPACADKTFARWPDGWDAHAAHKCAALESKEPAARKVEYKATFRHLFRG